MPRSLVFLAVLLAPAPITAQAFVRVGAGVTASTDFVKDFIVEPIGSRQSMAPTVTGLVGWRLPSGNRLGVEVRYAMGTWELADRGVTDDLGGLVTLGVALVGDGPIRGALRWEAVAGKLAYRPEREVGLFSGGAPSPWLVGGGLTWSRPMGGALALVVGARYDYHGFNTDRLDGDDYTGRQAVHRLGLSLALERGF